MRNAHISIRGKDVLDIVGTGGDCANTFNISTTSSFVIAAAGVPVAKHGNRSVFQQKRSCRCFGRTGCENRSFG